MAEHIGIEIIWFLGIVAVIICLHMIWSMLRYPLGDASPSPLYPLPPKIVREETTAQTSTEEGGTISSTNERVESH
jgi:hypothetical protein